MEGTAKVGRVGKTNPYGAILNGLMRIAEEKRSQFHSDGNKMSMNRLSCHLEELILQRGSIAVAVRSQLWKQHP